MADALRGHLVFSCGTGNFGVPAEWASEVVNLPTLTSVPGAPAHVLGVFALRGELMPVVDLLLLTGSTPNPNPWKRGIVIRGRNVALTLAATRVFGVGPLEGSKAPVREAGIGAYLLGPLHGNWGDVLAVEPDGFVEFLSLRP